MKQKVLLVDDDILIRVHIKSLINWGDNGFSLVGDAENGKEALEMIEAFEPDIVITDMKMPVMDGIELINNIKIRKLPINIIVLSAYNEFDLVRKAMRLGVEDYILKMELSRETFLSNLNKFKRKEDGKETISRENIEKDILKDLISGFYINSSEILAKMKGSNINFSGDVHCIILKAGELYNFEKATLEEYRNFQLSIILLAEEIIGDYFKSYSVEAKTGEFYFLCCLKKEHIEKDINLILKQSTDRLCAMLFQYINIYCICGVASGGSEPQNITQTCQQAAQTLKYRFYSDESALFWSDIKELSSISNKEEYLSHRVVVDIKNAIEFLNQTKVKETIEELKRDIEKYDQSVLKTRAVVIDILTSVQEIIYEYGLTPKRIMEKSKQSFDDILKLSTRENIFLLLDYLEDDLIRYIKAEKQAEYPKIVKAAEKYIKENYMSNISLQTLSYELELTPGYLSTLLKKHTGKTFSEYLLDIRMQSAKKLLKNSNLKVYEVGIRSGYPDQFYFSRLFKQITGLSPLEYRNR